jgi:uncharacterized NAD-dependent epimerase/dehydratase family protein
MSTTADRVRRRLAPFVAECRIKEPIISSAEALAGAQPVTVVTIAAANGVGQNGPKLREEINRALADVGSEVVIAIAP